VIASALALLGACGTDGSGSGTADDGHAHSHDPATTATTAPPFAKADATTAIDVLLQDYAFVGIPDTIAGPNVHFATSIKGSNAHELLVYDADDELAGDVGPFKRPGRLGLAVVLAPGTYRVACLVKEGSRTHAELGMRKTFTVS